MAVWVIRVIWEENMFSCSEEWDRHTIIVLVLIRVIRDEPKRMKKNERMKRYTLDNKETPQKGWGKTNNCITIFLCWPTLKFRFLTCIGLLKNDNIKLISGLCFLQTTSGLDWIFLTLGYNIWKEFCRTLNYERASRSEKIANPVRMVLCIKNEFDF